jgi:CheY-like chemotaxis protein
MPDDPAPCILLVEDEPLIRMLTVDMLEALGFAAIEAANGSEALAMDDQTLRSVAGLMIDLGLPDGPGEEVARRLRQRRPDLPVILTTGADASAARAGLAGNGPVGVLEKPYQLNDLSRALGTLQPAARGVA